MFLIIFAAVFLAVSLAISDGSWGIDALKAIFYFTPNARKERAIERIAEKENVTEYQARLWLDAKQTQMKARADALRAKQAHAARLIPMNPVLKVCGVIIAGLFVLSLFVSVIQWLRA